MKKMRRTSRKDGTRQLVDLTRTPELLHARNELEIEFKQLTKLNRHELIYIGLASGIGIALDALCIGIPHPTRYGLSAGPIPDFVNKTIHKVLTQDRIDLLSDAAHVPFDAPNNLKTIIHVDGLNPFMHRLVSLGHDPVLGLLFGTVDIQKGTMTTIDLSGNIVSQVMRDGTPVSVQSLLHSLCLEIIHLLSDAGTPMGLPMPFMSLGSLLRFKLPGEEDLLVSDVIQSLYFQGYNLNHFIAQGFPGIIAELIVRICFFAEIRVKHIDMDPKMRKQKLAMLLTIMDCMLMGGNIIKTAVTKNPASFNYAQLLRTMPKVVKQLIWHLKGEKAEREAFIEAGLKQYVSDNDLEPLVLQLGVSLTEVDPVLIELPA